MARKTKGGQRRTLQAAAIAAALGFAATTSLEARAHGGGLDASGCHNNHKTGGYHCHRPSGWRSLPDRGESLKYPEPRSPIHRPFEREL